MKRIMRFSCAGLCFLVLTISGCADKQSDVPPSFTAIGGTSLVFKEAATPVQLYGITTEDFIKTRTALQCFLAENPDPIMEHVATRLCDRTPLVILWSKGTEGKEKQRSVQEILLSQGAAKVDTVFFEKALKQENILKNKSNNTLHHPSYASLFHQFEKRSQGK